MRHITLSWYQHQPHPNFGDDLSPSLVEQITGRAVCHEEHAQAELFAIGSILGFWSGRKRAYQKTALDLIQGKAPLAIWGTGLIRPKTVYLPRCEVLALRGPLTQRHAGLKHTPLFGDPGILANTLVPARAREDCTGIVPHYVDKQHPAILALKDHPQFRIIDVERPCREVCAEISACAQILSSSLHGLVVADSYGIPNARLVLSNEIIGGDFKFADYAFGIGRDMPDSYAVTRREDIQEAALCLTKRPGLADPDTVHHRSLELIKALQEWALG